MLKKSLLVAMAAFLAAGASAETLSPDAALRRAQGNGRSIAGVQPTLAYTAKTEKGQPAVYVFNQAGGGSLILSASNLAFPMLGYTDSGSFDPSQMPPQMKALFEEYAAQIQYAEENNIQPSSTNVAFNYPTDWTFISPLVKTKWDQGKPYSNDLENPGYATGCVATAMAQVMKYHEYPTIGHGSNTYQVPTSYDQFGNPTSYKTYSMKFDEKPFDWENMILDYSTTKYTNAEAQAVAYLMKACGYSTNMVYGASSGTQVERAATALITFFGYDNSLRSLQRTEYTHSEWATMLYDQLKNVGPVLYSGHSLGGLAHAFVCDGYDGQGYFHINWGWSGLCDGYYSLDALGPSSQGTGGSSYGGFNFSQGMIMNIKPSEGTPAYEPEAEYTLLGNMSGTAEGAILTLTMTQANPGNLLNNSLVSIKPTFGISMENESSGDVNYAEVTGTYFYSFKDQFSTSPSWNAYSVPTMAPGSFLDPQFRVRAIFNTALPDGKYKVTLVWKDKTNGNTWKNFVTANGCHDYVYVTKQGNNYTVDNLPINRFVIDSAEVITPLYMRNPCQISFTITNPTDIELSQSVIPVLWYEGKASFEGDSQLVTVGPNETITTVLTYTFNQLSGATAPTTSTPREYTLGAYDYGLLWEAYYGTGNYGDSYYGDLSKVTMKRPGTNSSIRMRGINIGNAAEEGMVDGVGYMYGINDFSNIELNATVEGKSGFIASPLTAVVYEYDTATGGNLGVAYEKNFENLVFVEEGETNSVSTVLHMKDFDTSKIYNIVIYYVVQGQRNQLGSIRFGASSGVEDVAIGEGLNIAFNAQNVVVSSDAGIKALNVYDLGGKTVASAVCNGQEVVVLNLSSVARGIYLVNAVDTNGQTKTLKIRL